MNRLLLSLGLLALGLSAASAASVPPVCNPPCTNGLACRDMGQGITMCMPPITTPDGTMMGACRATAPRCDSSLSCVDGQCMLGGGLGDACTQSDECMSGHCLGGRCDYPAQSDSDTGSLAPGSPCTDESRCANGACFLGKCVDLGKCTPECDFLKQQVCMFSICQDLSKAEQDGYFMGVCLSGKRCAAPSLQCFEADGEQRCLPAGMADLIPTLAPQCKTNAMCSNNTRCDTASGLCLPFVVPPPDCGGKCGLSEQCFNGVCLPKLPERGCSSPCNAAWGQSCNTLLGQCMFNTSVFSSLSCGNCDGVCLTQPSFFNLPPVCVSSTPCNLGNSVCPQDSFCRMGSSGMGNCQVCDDKCRQLRQALGDDLSAGGIVSQLVNSGLASLTNIVTAANTGALVTSGILQLNPDTLMMIDSTVPVQSMLLNAPTAAAARISGRVNVNTLQVSSSQSRLLLNGELVAANLEVQSGGALVLSMLESSVRFNMSKLTLNGELNVVGSSGALRFPANAADVTIGSSARVQLSENSQIDVSGVAGPTPWVFGSFALLQVPAGESFTASGDMVGEEARINIDGEATLSGRTMDVQLRLYEGATVRIDTTAAAAVGVQRIGELRFKQGESATVEVRGTRTSGSNLYFREVRCPSEATLRYQVTGSALAAVNAGMTLFNYGVDTWDSIQKGSIDKGADFACKIRVCGTEGPCVNLKSSQDPTSTGSSSSGAAAASGARRLLATDVELTATWEPTRLTVAGNGDGSGGAAATIAAQPMLLLALVFTALFAMLRM